MSGMKSTIASPSAKYLPFGTPLRSSAFSIIEHLSHDDYTLVRSLNNNSDSIPPTHKGNNEKPVTSVVKEVRRLAQPARTESEDCKLKDCRTIARKVIELQAKITRERDGTEVRMQQLLEDNMEVEQGCVLLDDKLKVINRENEQLEATLHHLQVQLEKVNMKNMELQHESDGFSNKLMVIESEKNTWIRKVQAAQNALKDVMWRGQSSPEQSILSDLSIKQPSKPRSVYDAVDAGPASRYKGLASAHVLDSTEYAPLSPVSSIPMYLKLTLLPPLTAGGGGGAEESPDSPDNMWAGSRNSASTVSVDSMHDLLTKKTKKRIEALKKNISPSLRLRDGAYRGYIPTGYPNIGKSRIVAKSIKFGERSTMRAGPLSISSGGFDGSFTHIGTQRSKGHNKPFTKSLSIVIPPDV